MTKNPVDIGRQVGYEFAKKLLTEGSPKIKKVIGVLAGRFQPYHRGHQAIYDALAVIVGKDNVYIGTSDVVEPNRSPFNFNEKKKIINTMFGIPTSRIVKVKSPFAPEEILRKFDPDTTAVITAFSEKDKGRLSGQYYKPYKKGMSLKGYEKEGYYIVPPVFKLSGQDISGTVLRDFFGSTKYSWKDKKDAMVAIYGKVDEELLKLFISKFSKKTKGINEGMISRVLIKNFRNRQNIVKLLQEGGAAGHMNHPFDDMNLTFGDLKALVELGLEGRLDIDTPITEKLDGQNISVSYKDGQVIFARNKSHMSGQGNNALSVSGIQSMFAGRGELSNAFGQAADDLVSAVSKLSVKQKDKIFANGRKWVSLEILYPPTQNVIPYGRNMLVFHHTMEVDDTGNIVNIEKGEGRMLAGMIKQINQDIQKTFTFRGPVVVTFPRTGNFGARKAYYHNEISRLQSIFGLSDSDSVMMWHQAWWVDFISRKAQGMKYGIPNNILMNLVKRWAFLDLSYGIADMKRDIKNDKFLDWVLNYEKENKEKQFKENISKFELLFLKLGSEILLNATGLLSVAPTTAAQSIRKEVESAVKELKSTTDVKKITKLKDNLRKLQSIGIDNIVPTEGIVFMYKGKLYKLTGAFAPVNQILGLLKY